MKSIRRVLIGWIVLAASSALAALIVRKKVPAFGGEDDDLFSVVAAMDGANFNASSKQLLEGRAVAFMGGIELDLTDAEPAPGAYLTLRTFMGGIDVIVPAHWRVEVMARAFMGGIANITDPDSADDGAAVLLIDALAVMGGIEIHEVEVR